MRVLVCGSRHFLDYIRFKTEMSNIIDTDDLQNHFIISGGAKGADSLAEDWAVEFDYPYQIFRADWDKYGKGAGPIRNKQMLNEGKPDLVIAFLAKGSRGTKNMIDQATKANIPVKVISITS